MLHHDRRRTWCIKMRATFQMISDEEFNNRLSRIADRAAEANHGEKWVTRVVFVMEQDRELIDALVQEGGEPEGDPIETFFHFGAHLSESVVRPVESVFVVAETVKDEIGVFGATPDGRLAVAYLETERTRWRKRIRIKGRRFHYFSSESRAHHSRHPAAAVLKGLGCFDTSRFDQGVK